MTILRSSLSSDFVDNNCDSVRPLLLANIGIEHHITHKGGRWPSRVTRSALVRDLVRLHAGAPGWPALAARAPGADRRVRELRRRTLPARVVVYYLLAMVLFPVRVRRGVEQAGGGPGLGEAVPGAHVAGHAAAAGGDDLCAAAAGLAGDGRLAGCGGRAAGRGGAGARVRARDAAGCRRRAVPGSAG